MSIFPSLQQNNQTKGSIFPSLGVNPPQKPVTQQIAPVLPKPRPSSVSSYSSQPLQNYGLGNIQKPQAVWAPPQAQSIFPSLKTAKTTAQTTYQDPVNVGKGILQGAMAVGNVAKEIPQAVARTVGTVGITSGNIFQKSLGNQAPFQETIDTTGSPITKAIFGDTPIKDFTRYGEAGVKTVEDITGLKIDPKFAPFYAGAGVAMDISGTGGARKKVGESLFRKGTSEAFQRADAEITTQMTELSHAGKRIGLPDGTTHAYSSSFPEWVPSPLRQNSLFKDVVKHYEAGTIPSGVRQKELLTLMQKKVQERAVKYGDVPTTLGTKGKTPVLKLESQPTETSSKLPTSQEKGVQKSPLRDDVGKFSRSLEDEAKKYKSAEEFVNAQRDKFIKEQGFEPSDKALGEWFEAKQVQPYLGVGGQNPEFFAGKPSLSELPKNEVSKYLEFTKDGKAIYYRGIPKDVKTRGIRYGDFLSPNKGKASFYGNVERYELDPKYVKQLGDLEAVYLNEADKLKIPKVTKLSQLTDIYNKAHKNGTDVIEPPIPTKALPKQVDKTIQTTKVPTLRASQLVVKSPQLSQKSISSDLNKLANSSLNVNNLIISKEGRDLITQTVQEVKPLIEKSVGKVLSNSEAIALAEHSSKVISRVTGREETLDWQASMLKARQALAHASETGTVDGAYIRNLLTIKTQGADIARKLQSLSVGAHAIEPTTKEAIIEAVLKVNDNVDEILKAAEGVDFTNLKQATEFYRKFIKPTAGEWLDLLRYNSMLSSPKTHIINVFSNLLNTTLIAPLEKSLTGGLDFLGSKLTGKEREAFAGEGGAYLKGYLTNVKEATFRLAEVMRGNRAYTNLDTRYIPLATKGVKGALVKSLSVPTKILEGMDQFFMALAEGGSKNQLAYRSRKGGKVGNLQIEAENDASYRLFRQKPVDESQGPLLDAVDQFTIMVQGLRNNKNPIVSNIAKFTIPFIQTPMNIFKQGLEYSPVGFGTIVGAENKTQQLSKAIIGSSIFAGAATLLTSNRLTWGEPTEANAKRDFKASGMQPYSVKIGDTWYSYQKLPPGVAFPLAMVSLIHDTLQNKKIDDNTVDLVLSGIAKYGQFLTDQSYAKSISDLLGAAKGGEAGIARIVSNYGQQLVPYRALGGWLAKLTDHTQRKIDSKAGFIDQQVQLLMLNIPGLSQKVPARLDKDGYPIPSPNPISNAFSPIQTSLQTEQQTKKYEGILKLKQLQKEKTVQNADAKSKIQPIYDTNQQLKAQGKLDEVQKNVDALSEEDYATYKKIQVSDRAKHTETTRYKLALDPKEAVQYVRSLPQDEIDRIVNLLTDEEYALYEQGKSNI